MALSEAQLWMSSDSEGDTAPPAGKRRRLRRRNRTQERTDRPVADVVLISSDSEESEVFSNDDASWAYASTVQSQASQETRQSRTPSDEETSPTRRRLPLTLVDNSTPTVSSRRSSVAAAAPERGGGASRQKTATRRTPTRSSIDWLREFAPSCSEEVEISPRKRVAELRLWLRVQRGGRLAVFTGPPGAGKSTLVRVVAAEMGYRIQEWTDKNSDRGDAAYRPETVSSADDFAQFLRRASRVQPLQLGGSTSHHQPHAPNMLLLIDEIPPAYAPSGYSNNGGRGRSLGALLEEVLFHHGCRHPIVLIRSTNEDGSATNGSNSSIQRWIGPTLANRAGVTTVFSCRRLPPSFLQRALRRVAAAASSSATNREARITAATVSSVANSCGGDLRHAIMTLELAVLERPGNDPKPVQRAAPAKRGNAQPPPLRDMWKESVDKDMPAFAPSSCGRDDFMDAMHLVGKLLYPKRKDTSTLAASGDAGSGAFKDPLDSVAAGIPFHVGTLLSCVSMEAPGRFTRMDDLAAATSVWCDADMLLGQAQQGNGRAAWGSEALDLGPRRHSSLLPDGYVRAWVARSIAVHNRHPAVGAFQPIRGVATARGQQQARAENWEWVRGRGLGIGWDLVHPDANSFAVGRRLVPDDPVEGRSRLGLLWTQSRAAVLDRLPTLRFMLPYPYVQHIPRSDRVHALLCAGAIGQAGESPMSWRDRIEEAEQQHASAFLDTEQPLPAVPAPELASALGSLRLRGGLGARSAEAVDDDPIEEDSDA